MTKEHILFLLKYKQFVVLEDKNANFWRYIVMSSFKNEIRYSPEVKRIEDGLYYQPFVVKDDLTESMKKLTIHSTFDLPKQRHEIERKVRVREDVEEWFKFYGMNFGDKHGLKNLEGKIEGIHHLYYTVRINNFFTALPHEALDPVYEEHEHIERCHGKHTGPCITGFNKEQWLKEGEENGMLRDGKVVV